MKRMILAGILALLPFCAWADDAVGRYQAVAIPEAANSGFAGKILFLDTRDGHVWVWRNARAIDSSAYGGGFTYIGRLAPASAAPAQPAPQAGVAKCFAFNGKQFCE